MDDASKSAGQEFLHLFEAAGITIPEDRRDAVLRGCIDLHRRVALLHAQPSGEEPAFTFDPVAAALR